MREREREGENEGGGGGGGGGGRGNGETSSKSVSLELSLSYRFLIFPLLCLFFLKLSIEDLKLMKREFNVVLDLVHTMSCMYISFNRRTA